MQPYSLILFVHVISSMGMIACLSLLILGEEMARRVQSPAELSSIGDKQLRVASVLKAIVPVLALSGLYMAWSAWSLRAAWVIVAFLALVYLTLSGPLVFAKRMQRARDAAVAAGAITPAVRAILDDPAFAMIKHIRLGLVVMIVFLMTTKPGFVGTLVALGAAVVLGAVSARTRFGVPIDSAKASVAAPEV
ncbi:MAG: hypothetical protein ABI889_08340 [Gemmatimonadota bacterium]